MKDRYQLEPPQQYVLIDKRYCFINLWSKVHHSFLSHGAVINKYYGCLYSLRRPSSVR